MSTALLAKLHNGLRRIRLGVLPGPRILLYHRVTELPSDPQQLAVSPRHFAEQLAVLRQFAYPMSLSAMMQALREGHLPRRAVAVTFDDGYADNLLFAKPLLEEYAMPATIFVVSGQLGSTEEFWWDDLARLLLEPGTLPAELRMTVAGAAVIWQAGASAAYRTADAMRDAGWHVGQRDDPTPRQQLYRVLCDRLRPLPAPARQEVLAQLQTWAGAGVVGRSSHRALACEELMRLPSTVVEVGAHTVTHSFLAGLPLAEQQREIAESRQRLEAIIGRPVTTFSYPFGTTASYSAETQRLAREAGMVCACANVPDRVGLGTDPFQLPRVLVRDWDGDTFYRHFQAFLRG